MKTDFDGAWKRALKKFLPHCFQLLFPAAHARIDWARGVAFLDKELERAARDTKFPELRVDKLIRVYLKGGGALWMLIHIEIQSQHDKNFALRMCVYNCRIFDLYGRPVASFAVLADDSASWRPDCYARELLGSRLELRFPIVKLKDFELRIGELERSSNPFALVVLAHLRTQESKKNDGLRTDFKRELYRLAYRSGYSKADIRELLIVIDWMLVLPDTVQAQLTPELDALEKETPVEFMNYYARQHMKKGELKMARESVIVVLRAHFQRIPAEIKNSVLSIEDIATLKKLQIRAVKCKSLDDFKSTLAK